MYSRCSIHSIYRRDCVLSTALKFNFISNMFWTGKVSWFVQLEAFLKQQPLRLLPYSIPPPHATSSALIAQTRDAPGIAKLLNECFEPASSRCKTATTVEWVIGTFIQGAIWIVVKDSRGTIRGCIGSFPCPSPYRESTYTSNSWGQVDWYCVHPLWRSKGLGSALLKLLDHATYVADRRAHVFLKEGIPLPLPHIPVYMTRLYCRRAGNPAVYVMPQIKGVYPYMTKETATGLPLVRVSPILDQTVHEWEKGLDTFLPPCIVFVSSMYDIDMKMGWAADSLVSMYAFRWVAGKWLGSRPHTDII